MSAKAEQKVFAKAINNVKVTPIQDLVQKKHDPRPVRGSELFSELYCNIGVIARKKSGKTSVIGTILNSCAGPNTKVFAFCSSLRSDEAWKSIEAGLHKKGIRFYGYQSIYDTEAEEKNTRKGFDLIKDLTDHLLGKNKKQAEEEEEEKPDKRSVVQEGKGGTIKGTAGKPVIEVSDDDLFEIVKAKQSSWAQFGSGPREDVIKHKKAVKKSVADKYQSPEYIIVFDDISDELKAPSIATLLKVHRHLRAKVILSSQYLHDLKPESLKQLDYWLLFGGQPLEKIEKVRKDAGLAVSKEELAKLYEIATAEKYSFLYIDKPQDKFRKGFNTELLLKK